MSRSTSTLHSSAGFGVLRGLRARRVAACAVAWLALAACGGGSLEARLAEVHALQDATQYSASVEPLREILAQNPDHPEANMLLGVALLSLNDALIKTLTSRYPVGELLFVRGAFVCPWILVLARLNGGLHTLRINSFGGRWRSGPVA